VPRANTNPRNEYPEAVIKEAIRLKTVEKLPLSKVAQSLGLSRARVTTMLDREGLGCGRRGKHAAPSPPKQLSQEELLDQYLANPSKGSEILRQLVGGLR
jgi:hypothetical protein